MTSCAVQFNFYPPYGDTLLATDYTNLDITNITNFLTPGLIRVYAWGKDMYISTWCWYNLCVGVLF
jgi:hypothetical protein